MLALGMSLLDSYPKAVACQPHRPGISLTRRTAAISGQYHGLGSRSSAAFPGNDEQHRRHLVVEAFDFAAIDRQRIPVPRIGVGRAQPVLRGIVVIAIERVAAVAIAFLVTCEEIALRLQRAPDPRENIRKLKPWHMKQAGVGPDAVIGLDLVEVMKQQRPDGTTETLGGDSGHFRRSVGCTNIKSTRQHFRRVTTGAASEFENASARRKPR